jgi:sulfatase modifying factor 1
MRKKKNIWNMYFLTFGISLLLFGVPVFLFNLYADYTGTFWPDSSFKGEILPDNRRIVTPALVRSLKPDCILTGTSRVGRGFPLDHSTLRNYLCPNLYFSGGDAHEISKVIQYAVAKSKIRLVLIGIDFFMFDEDLDIENYTRRFKLSNYEPGHKQFLMLEILSNGALLFSTDALKKNWAHLRKPTKTKREIGKATFGDITGRVLHSPIDAMYGMGRQLHGVVREGGHGYGGYRLSARKLDNLIDTLKILKIKGIPYKIFMNPVYVSFNEAIRALGLLDDYRLILKRIAQEVGDAKDTFYDFNNYNKVSAEFFGREASGCLPEAGHYASEVGDAILKIMLNGRKAQDAMFGKNITASNVKEHFRKVERRRELWKKKYKRDDDIFKEVLACSLNGKSHNCVARIVNDAFLKWAPPEFVSHVDFKRKKCVLLNPRKKKKAIFLLKTVKTNVPMKTVKTNVPMQTVKTNVPMQTVKTNVPMQLIPEGEFVMGTRVGNGFSDEMPQRKKNLKAFLIDRYEVTNEEFRNSGIKPRMNSGRQFSHPKQPVTGISWIQARNYCEMVGKRLPTESEWEKAARGTDGRRYPWGNEWPDCNKAVFNGDPGMGCGRGAGPWPVGSKPAGVSPYGVMDMIGNVSEFVSDTYDPGYYLVSPVQDPANKGNENEKEFPKDTKVMRGGHWSSPRYSLRATQRFPVGTDYGAGHVGFRCARDVKKPKVGK